MTETPARRWPKTGNVGASTQLRTDEQPVTVPARPYPGEEVVLPLSNRVPLGDLYPAMRRLGDPPTPDELRQIADDLNTHGGLDETFVAELLRQAADPYADAKRQLGIVDPPPTPVKTTEPITYETIVEALEKIAPLGPQRLDVVKLTQEQIDAVTASQPHVAPSAEPWHFFGTPVEIVETVEESTPYRLAQARRPLGMDPLTHARRQLEVVSDTPPSALANPRPPGENAADFDGAFADLPRELGIGPGIPCRSKLIAITNPYGGEPSVAERLVLSETPMRRQAATDGDAWYYEQGGADDTAAFMAGAVHQHIWTTSSPMRCVECRRYLRPWWRRALDRARRWGR